MSNLLAEARLAVRNLLKTPSLTCTALLTLALGIGANTAVFSVVDGVLLRPLPYAEPERIVAIRANQSLPEVDDIRAESRSIVAVAGVVRQPLDLTGGAEPLQVDAGLVTGDLFDLLGVAPVLGRPLVAEDDRLGGERVAVLGHGLWQREFGADPGVLGRAVGHLHAFRLRAAFRHHDSANIDHRAERRRPVPTPIHSLRSANQFLMVTT